MRQPTIRQRKRRGIITFYCDLGGKQHGLGTDPGKAKTLFAELLAKHHGRQELAAPAEDKQPQEKLKVRAILLMFLEWCKRNRAPGTYRFYSDGISGDGSKGFVSFDAYLLKNKLADLLVADFGPHHVQDWITDHFAKHSDNYKHNLIRTVQAAFNWAMGVKSLRRQIGEHPLMGLKKPGQTPREAYVTAEQWAKVVTTVEGEFLDLLTVLKESGCRPQEARAAEAKHFDREGRRLYFPEPVKKTQGKKEPRIIYLNDRAFEICQRLALKHPTGPLFANENGQAWNKDSINHRCQRLRKPLGFNLCVYALRHSFCTDALKRGVDPLTIAKLMGHKNASMVMDVYNRLSECQGHLRDALHKATG